MHPLDAAGADLGADAFYFCPLEIGVLAGPVGGVIVAAQKDAVAAHLGSFVAGCAGSHGSRGLASPPHYKAALVI